MTGKIGVLAAVLAFASPAFADPVTVPEFAQRMMARGILGSISQTDDAIVVASGPLYAEGDAPSREDTINALAAFYAQATPDTGRLVFTDGATGNVIATREW